MDRPSDLRRSRPTASGEAGGEGAGDAAGGASGTTEALPPRPLVAAEARQRWRVTYAREPVAGQEVGRAALDAWQEALAASGLPAAGLEAGGSGRARIAFAAPLPAMASGEAELADVLLLERRTALQVREALEGRLPLGHRWISAEDVWLGAPPLAGQVAAADWRVVVAAADGVTPAAAGVSAAADPAMPDDPSRLARSLDPAARRLLDAAELARVRQKGGGEKRYDLRPLLAELAVEAAPDGQAGRAVVRIRTRIRPELGAGRPEEVVAALAEAAGVELAVESIVRTRLLLLEDIEEPGAHGAAVPSRRPISPRRPLRR